MTCWVTAPTGRHRGGSDQQRPRHGGVGYDTLLSSAKVTDDTVTATISTTIAGIDWAVGNGARVINISLDNEDKDCDPWWDPVDGGVTELQEAIDDAWRARVVVVAAAGNKGVGSPRFPAGCRNVVGVANIKRDDTKTTSSNYGKWVDLAAPGEDVVSTAVAGAAKCQRNLSNGYALCSGTSTAAPHVSGLAALNLVELRLLERPGCRRPHHEHGRRHPRNWRALAVRPHQRAKGRVFSCSSPAARGHDNGQQRPASLAGPVLARGVVPDRPPASDQRYVELRLGDDERCDVDPQWSEARRGLRLQGAGLRRRRLLSLVQRGDGIRRRTPSRHLGVGWHGQGDGSSGRHRVRPHRERLLGALSTGDRRHSHCLALSRPQLRETVEVGSLGRRLQRHHHDLQCHDERRAVGACKSSRSGRARRRVMISDRGALWGGQLIAVMADSWHSSRGPVPGPGHEPRRTRVCVRPATPLVVHESTGVRGGEGGSLHRSLPHQRF